MGSTSSPLQALPSFIETSLRIEGTEICVLFKVEGSEEALPSGNFEIEDGFIEAEDLYDSVDEKAERFIETFYQQMRMQSQNPYISSSHSSLCGTA